MELLPNISPAKKGTAIKFVLSIGSMLNYPAIEKEISEKGYNLQHFFDVSGKSVFGVFWAIPK